MFGLESRARQKLIGSKLAQSTTLLADPILGQLACCAGSEVMHKLSYFSSQICGLEPLLSEEACQPTRPCVKQQQIPQHTGWPSNFTRSCSWVRIELITGRRHSLAEKNRQPIIDWSSNSLGHAARSELS